MTSASAWIMLATLLILAANVRLAASRRAWRGGVEPSRRETLVVRVRSSGIVSAKNVKVVRSSVDAPVLKKYVAAGDAVKKGQLLLKFDDRDLIKTLQSARNDLNVAQRELAKTTKEVSVQKHLLKLGAVARKAVEDAQEAREQAAFKLSRARTACADAQGVMNGIMVRSPMKGYVLNDEIQDQDSSARGKTLFEVGTLDTFVVKAGVDEVDLAKIKVGQEAQLRVDAFPETVLTGRVTAIAPGAERTSFAKIPILINIIDAKGLPLKPNISVDVRIIAGRIQDVLTIPVGAVSRRGGETQVLVVTPLGRTRWRTVTLGDGSGERVIVRSGLRAGEPVVLNR